MSKYDPLRRHLEGVHAGRVTMSFAELEEIVGFRLPASARRYAAWWSNSDVSHVQAGAWLGAGFETADVDIAGEKVSFRKATMIPGLSEGAQAQYAREAAEEEEEEYVIPSEYFARLGKPVPPIFTCMKGTLTILPGVDLTAPADPDWGKIYDDPDWGKNFEDDDDAGAPAGKDRK